MTKVWGMGGGGSDTQKFQIFRNVGKRYSVEFKRKKIVSKFIRFFGEIVTSLKQATSK